MTRNRWWIGVPVVVVLAGLIGGCFALKPRGSLPEPIQALSRQRDDWFYVVILYSLEPGPPGGTSDMDDDKTFHGHTILGRTTIDEPVARKKLFATLRQGITDHDGSVAACFIPHHGLRIKYGKTCLDLIICFQCAQVKVYESGKEGESFLISTSPRATFNDILRAAKVPLSSSAE